MRSQVRNLSPFTSIESTQNQANLDCRTILIVDDNEETLYLIRSILLRELQLNVLLAKDGATAIRILMKEKVDLVLLDHLMPGISGFETLALIKDEERFRDVPVLMFSALDSLESAARCIMHGADDFLIKPLDPDLLRVKVSAMLEKKKLRDIKNDFTLHLEKTNADLLRKINELDIAHRESVCANQETGKDRSRLMVLTEASMEGLAIHERGMIIDCNKRFGAIFGVDHRQVTGKALIDIVDEGSRQPLMDAINNGKENWTLTVNSGGHGGRRPLEINGRLFPKDGNWLSTISVRELGSGAINAGLYEKSVEKSLALVSQSVREPLSTMASMINALETADLSANVREQIVSRMRSMATSMIGMVDGLMEIDRLENRKRSPALALTNVWSMAEEAIEGNKTLAGATGVGLVNLIPRGWNVMTDSELLIEALGKLVFAAIKFSSQGGAVTVGMAKDAEDRPAIFVRRQGPGRDSAHFRQALEGAPNHGSADMSLALAARIAVALKGSLTCGVPEEDGATFYLALPGAAVSALIITSDRLNAVKLTKTMELAGVDASIACSAAEALGILRMAHPQVVVADAFLVNSSGEKEAEEISKILNKAGGPVVVSLVERPGAGKATPESLEISPGAAAETLATLIGGILGKR